MGFFGTPSMKKGRKKIRTLALDMLMLGIGLSKSYIPEILSCDPTIKFIYLYNFFNFTTTIFFVVLEIFHF